MGQILAVFSICYQWLVCVFRSLVPRRFRFRKDVSGETVLITGAGSGFGRLLSFRFANLGSKLVLWDLDPKGLEETCKLLKESDKPCELSSYLCDVSDREAVRKTAQKVKDEVGNVTILVNNCGIVVGKFFLDLNETEMERVMKVNTFSHFWMCKAFLPDMMSSNHGHLVTMASCAGKFGIQKLSDYCASKHAVVGFEESIRQELEIGGYDGVHTTIVCPYFTSTGMFQGLGKTSFISLQSPEHVVNEIMDGVLMNVKEVMIPRSMSFVLWMKTVLPTAVYSRIMELADTKQMMKDFEGRKKVLTEPMLPSKDTREKSIVNGS